MAIVLKDLSPIVLDMEKLSTDIGYWLTHAPDGSEAYCTIINKWVKWVDDRLAFYCSFRNKWKEPLSKEEMLKTDVSLVCKPIVDFDITIDITDLNVAQIGLSIEAYERLGIVRVSGDVVSGQTEILSNACFTRNVTRNLLRGKKGDNIVTFTYRELLSLANLYDYTEKATDTKKSNTEVVTDSDEGVLPFDTSRLSTDIGYWLTYAPIGSEAYCELNSTWVKWLDDRLTFYCTFSNKWKVPLSKDKMFDTSVRLIYRPKSIDRIGATNNIVQLSFSKFYIVRFKDGEPRWVDSMFYELEEADRKIAMLHDAAHGSCEYRIIEVDDRIEGKVI